MNQATNFQKQMQQAVELEIEMMDTLKVTDADTGEEIPYTMLGEEFNVDSKHHQRVKISYMQNGKEVSSILQGNGKRTLEINGEPVKHKSRQQRRHENRIAERALKKFNKTLEKVKR